jgi:hypothetical protein
MAVCQAGDHVVLDQLDHRATGPHADCGGNPDIDSWFVGFPLLRRGSKRGADAEQTPLFRLPDGLPRRC